MKRFALVLPLLVVTIVLAQAPERQQDSPATSQSPNGEKIYSVGVDGVELPSCYYMPNPPYSKEARSAKFEGIVLVDGIVRPDGRLSDLRIVESPGMGLDKLVLSTMKKWKCTPSTHGGKKVAVRLPFQIRFRLNSSD
jgi:protein TonB